MKNEWGRRIGLAFGACMIVLASFSNASAWGHHFGRWGYYRPYWGGVRVLVPPIGAFVAYLPDGYTTYVVGGVPYYYYGGTYFTPYSSGYVVVPAPVENVPSAAQTAPTTAPAVSTTPAPAQSKESQSSTSSSGAGTEAKSLSSASAPSQTITGQQKSSASDTVAVNIPNSKGGFSSVKLVKHKDGYLGPQGEFYAGHPSVDQLKALYGN